MSKSKELSVEEQIAKLEKETQEKIKELRNGLTWEKRFQSVMNAFVKSNSGLFNEYLDGYAINSIVENQMNLALKEVNLKVKYNSATFDNDFTNSNYSNLGFADTPDASEYPVYVVFKVLDLQDNEQGFVKFDSFYSSYNGNEFSGYKFVKPKQITCTVFDAYKV